MRNNIKLLATAAVVVVSSNALAKQDTLVGTFETIKNVTISEDTPIAVKGIYLVSGANCTTSASTDGTGTNYPGDVAMRLAGANSNAAGSTVGALSSSNSTCLTSTTGSTLGFYTVDGAPGATVDITVVDGDSGSVTLAPSGCVGDYDGGADGDSCVALNSGTPASIQLASAGDTGTLGEGTPIAGQTRIALGATATASTTLTAGTPYPVDFQINVTY